MTQENSTPQQETQEPDGYVSSFESGSPLMCGLDEWQRQGLIAVYRAPQPALTITDEAIDRIAESMSGGLDGFLKSWGWRQFARAYVDADRAARSPADSVPSPQQEAQEPAPSAAPAEGYSGSTYAPGDADIYERLANKPVAPVEGTARAAMAAQPAPAPLSEREMFEETWEKAHGKKPVLWETMFAQQKQGIPPHCVGRYFYREEQAAWGAWQARAALAAQGGTR